MPNQKGPIENELLLNVKRSTQNALEALKEFEKSLIRGRLAEGLPAYETMCNTLVGQRIWSLDKKDPDLNTRFNELAVTAQNIIKILQPYVSNFEKLAQFIGDEQTIGQTLESLSAPESEDNHNELKIKKILKNRKKNCSLTKLRSEIRLRKDELQKVLDKLVASGEIAVIESGGRKFIQKMDT